jgi:hypothetical protein
MEAHVVNTVDMLPDEAAFVHTYVTALRRDFDLLYAAVHLMNPATFNTANIVTAAEKATQLVDISTQYTQKLQALSTRHAFREKRPIPWPPNDAIADFFHLSFFKVLSGVDAGTLEKFGWFSGAPESWADIAAPEQDSGAVGVFSGLVAAAKITNLTKAAKKLFGGFDVIADILSQFKNPPEVNWPSKADGFFDDLAEDDDWDDDDNYPNYYA